MAPILHPPTPHRATYRLSTGGIAVLALTPTVPSQRPVIATHGWPAGNDAATVLAGASSNLNGLLAAGHPVYIAFTGTTWNTDTIYPAVDHAGGHNAIDAAIDAADTDGHDTELVNLFAVSHGGAVAMRWAWEHPDRLAAAYLYAPFTSFAGTYQTAAAGAIGVRTSMLEVTGAADLDELIDATRAYEPLNNAAALNPLGERIAILGVTTDEVIPIVDLEELADTAGATLDTTAGSHFFITTTSWDELDVARWYATHT